MPPGRWLRSELEDKVAQLRGQLPATSESLAGAKAHQVANLRPELSEQSGRQTAWCPCAIGRGR